MEKGPQPLVGRHLASLDVGLERATALTMPEITRVKLEGRRYEPTGCSFEKTA